MNACLVCLSVCLFVTSATCKHHGVAVATSTPGAPTNTPDRPSHMQPPSCLMCCWCVDPFDARCVRSHLGLRTVRWWCLPPSDTRRDLQLQRCWTRSEQHLRRICTLSTHSAAHCLGWFNQRFEARRSLPCGYARTDGVATMLQVFLWMHHRLCRYNVQ